MLRICCTYWLLTLHPEENPHHQVTKFIAWLWQMWLRLGNGSLQVH
jgi:hypothetical protein